MTTDRFSLPGDRPATRHRRILALGLLLAAAWLAAGPLPAEAQDNTEPDAAAIEGLFRCLGITEETLRLQCYDAIVQQLADARVDPEFRGENTLHAFSGRDDHDTEPLRIDQAWRAHWVFEGSILTIELRLPSGELVNIVGNQIGSGQGNTELLRPGEYRLAVRAIGKWQIAVEPE